MGDSTLPYDVEVRCTPETYRAVCRRCGWHTLPDPEDAGRRRSAELARNHLPLCPNPAVRNGALMGCGCWFYDVRPGETARERKYTCPIHGETEAVKMNTEDFQKWGTTDWTRDPASLDRREQLEHDAEGIIWR